MAKTFTVTDLREKEIFPNVRHRFSDLRETDAQVILQRDYLGENPLHYYNDIKRRELIVANNIIDIKNYLGKSQRKFIWESVRAVSNNTRTTIDSLAFISASPTEEEIEPPLQDLKEYEPQFFWIGKNPVDYIGMAGRTVRALLQESIDARLSSISKQEIGLLLSGGLDSMSVGYLLSKVKGRKVTAFTLKVNEDEQDVVKSRELATRFSIDLSEIKINQEEAAVSITLQRYSPARELRYTRRIAENINLNDVVFESLKISGNPKKDNLFCAVAMYLIGQAITTEGIKTVFCGEGPNEMINDYGYNPRDFGYRTEDKGDISFREALTFGFKRSDRQLGRGGLAKHATARMGKIFAHYGLRLEAPYFTKDIARVMTKVPHVTSYDTIKQHLVGAMFEGEGLHHFIRGTSKEKFQDGSGISRLLKEYDQQKLIDLFDSIYGIKKIAYLK